MNMAIRPQEAQETTARQYQKNVEETETPTCVGTAQLFDDEIVNLQYQKKKPRIPTAPVLAPPREQMSSSKTFQEAIGIDSKTFNVIARPFMNDALSSKNIIEEFWGPAIDWFLNLIGINTQEEEDPSPQPVSHSYNSSHYNMDRMLNHTTTFVSHLESLTLEEWDDIKNFDQFVQKLYMIQKEIQEEGGECVRQELIRLNNARKELVKEHFIETDKLTKKQKAEGYLSNIDKAVTAFSVILTCGKVLASGTTNPLAYVGVALTVGLMIETMLDDPLKKKLAEVIGNGDQEQEDKWLLRLQIGAAFLLVGSTLALGASQGDMSALEYLAKGTNAITKTLLAIKTYSKNTAEGKVMVNDRDLETNERSTHHAIEQLHTELTTVYNDIKAADELETARYYAGKWQV